jgi:hypothetical protein
MSDPAETAKPEQMDRDRFKVTCPHCGWQMTGWLNPSMDDRPAAVNRGAPDANCARCDLDFAVEWDGAPVYEAPPGA